ncbi:hypothetical protein Tco_0634339, partial [Tanacetum coccineum]
LTSKDVLKVAFDLNLLPAATDTDVQPVDDDDAILRDPQVCKNSFELSDSRATSLQVLEVADASDSEVRSSDDSEHKAVAL